jgi:dipeptidyl aminopeptidase/acylaminoacyl peptidase
MRRLSALVLLVALGSGGLHPRLATAQERTHDITPEDYASVNTITEIAVSPDGKQVAYCLATWDKKADDRKTDLWVVDTDGKGKPRQLTKDRANDRHPKWSGDGKAIYVLGNRTKETDKEKKDEAKPPHNGKAQVWKVSLDGGDPTAVTEVKDGVTGYDYAPKADAVFYSADAKATDEDDFTHLRKKFDKPEYAGGTRKVSEVFRVGKDGKPEKVIAEKRYVREFAVTADGKRVAMVTAIDDSVLKSEGESRVDVWEGGKVTTPPTDVYRKNASSPWAWLENLAWNPDGTRFAFNAIFDAYPTEIIVGELKDGTWATTRLPRGWGQRDLHVQGYGSPLKWYGEANLAYITEVRGWSNPIGFDTANAMFHRSWSVAPGTTYAFDLTSDGSAVTVSGTEARLPRLLSQGKGTDQTFLVDPNPQSATWKFPTVQHVTWKAPDGVEVGGPLELPPGWKKGDKPLPLVVAIHGGPTTSSPNDLRFDPHNGRLYFAAKGYAVLCPNYRGSTGYGDKFVTDLIGRENDVEVKDILAGIQHLIKEGVADPERVAVMGWSNGGYLTNCLIALKDPPVKIKAASSGAGIVDTVAEWGFNDEPAYPRVFKKGLPWEQPDVYRKTSPTYQLGNVRTPTLIHVGGDDVRCPPGHSRMLHRALKEYVNVPTELVVYPGEPHGLTKLSNRVAKMEWDLAWFEKYLKK